MTHIKICGITRAEDALAAASLGVDALGFIFYEKSKRFINPQEAGRIIRNLPPFIATVGVFVDASLETIQEAKQAAGVSCIQLHGDESPEFCAAVDGRVIKAFRVHEGFDLDFVKQYKTVSAFLLDAWDESLKGGTGKPIDWTLALKANRFGNLILAGGLGPSNLAQAIEIVDPYAVDLNSGVEIMPGIKNRVKIKQAVDIIRKYMPKA